MPTAACRARACTSARMTPPCVTQTTGAFAPACCSAIAAAAARAARAHLGVRLALLPAGAAGEPARIALGVACLHLCGREPQPLPDVDLAPARVEHGLEARPLCNLLGGLARARRDRTSRAPPGVERDARGQRLRLGTARRAERFVVMSLPAVFRVPGGFAVADEEQALASPRTLDASLARIPAVTMAAVDLGLDGRACLVTGGTAGIGLADRAGAGSRRRSRGRRRARCRPRCRGGGRAGAPRCAGGARHRQPTSARRRLQRRRGSARARASAAWTCSSTTSASLAPRSGGSSTTRRGRESFELNVLSLRPLRARRPAAPAGVRPGAHRERLVDVGQAPVGRHARLQRHEGRGALVLAPARRRARAARASSSTRSARGRR